MGGQEGSGHGERGTSAQAEAAERPGSRSRIRAPSGVNKESLLSFYFWKLKRVLLEFKRKTTEQTNWKCQLWPGAERHGLWVKHQSAGSLHRVGVEEPWRNMRKPKVSENHCPGSGQCLEKNMERGKGRLF